VKKIQKDGSVFKSVVLLVPILFPNYLHTIGTGLSNSSYQEPFIPITASPYKQQEIVLADNRFT
jgi:hypothetical protein